MFDVNNAIGKNCQTFGYLFIDNSNVTTDTGLHLTNSGKGIILNNFIHFLSNLYVF